MTSNRYTSWVAPEGLQQKWLHEYFAPRFRWIDGVATSASQGLVRLGTLAQPAAVSGEQARDPQWMLRRRGDAIHVEPFSKGEFLGARAARLFGAEFAWRPLPDECLIVDAAMHAGRVAVSYWSREIFGGAAVAPRESLVLVGAGGDDIAWLVKELHRPIAVSQLERQCLGQMAPRLAIADLLRLVVQEHSTGGAAGRFASRTSCVEGLSRFASGCFGGCRFG
jgi:hypothetical protein